MKYMRILAFLLAGIYTQASAQWVQLPGKGAHSSLSMYAYDNSIVVATQDSNILRSTDQGMTWAHSSQGIQDSIYTYTLYGEGAIIYLGSNRGGYISTNGGEVWQKIDAGPSAPMNVLAFHRYGTYLFMGGDSGMFRSSDNGQTWQRLGSGLPTPGMVRVFGSNDKYLFAGVLQHSLYRSSDNGEHWEVAGTGLFPNVTFSVLWTEGADVIACLEVGGYYRSTDFGDTWKLHSDNFVLGNSIGRCWLQFGTVLLLGADRGVIRSLNKGAIWEDMSTGLTQPISVRAMSVSDDYVYVATTNRWIWRRPLAELLPPASVSAFASPYGMRLEQSIPNPATSVAEISYTLPSPAPVSLKLYNAMMEEVSTLVDEPQDAGEHIVSLDASTLPSGAYYYRLSTGTSPLTRRMVVVK